MLTMERNRQVDFETTRFAEESHIEYTKKKIKITDIIRHPDFKKQFDGKKFNKARFSSYIEKKLLAINELNFQREGINGMVKLFNLYIEESKLSERKTLWFEDLENPKKQVTYTDGGKGILQLGKNSSSWNFETKEGIFIYDDFIETVGKDLNYDFLIFEIEKRKDKLSTFDEDVQKILKFEENLQIYYNLKIQEISSSMRGHIKIKI